MLKQVPLLRELYAPLAALPPGMIASADCESLFAHVAGRRAVEDTYLGRHFLWIQ